MATQVKAEEFRGFYALRGDGLRGAGAALKAIEALHERQRGQAADRKSPDLAQTHAATAAVLAQVRASMDQDVAGSLVSIVQPDRRSLGISGRVTEAGAALGGVTVVYRSGERQREAAVGDEGTFMIEVADRSLFRLAVLNAERREIYRDDTIRYFVENDEVAFVAVDILRPQDPCRQGPRGGNPGTLIMPDLQGRALDDAIAEIGRLGLTLDRVHVVPTGDLATVGRVFSHEPPPGDPVELGAPVLLMVGATLFRDAIWVEDITGELLTRGVQRLREKGFEPGEVSVIRGDLVILDHRPPGGSRVPAGTRIDLTVGVTGDLETDLDTVAALFDLHPSQPEAKLKGATVLRRLADAGLRSFDNLREAGDLPDERLQALLQVDDPARLAAIRQALADAVGQVLSAR